MKIRVELTFDVDVAQWSQTYGIDGWDNLRADVRSWAASHFFHYADEDDHPVCLATWGPR